MERLFGLREGSISGDFLLLREPSLIPMGIAASLILFLSLIHLPMAFFRIRRARVSRFSRYCDKVISKEIAIAKLRSFGLGIGVTGILLALFYFTSLFGFFGLM